MSQLTLNRVSVQYQQHSVIENLSLTLEKGEIRCLLGPSGCGKSSLLKAIAGLHPISGGQIELAERVLSANHRQVAPEARKIGMVFQDIALFPHLSVAQNICFGLHKHPKRHQAERLHSLLALIGLEQMADRYPASLSGGQQQRVALARALAPQPEVLLLDEPFSGLDGSLKESLVPEVRDILKQTGTTALLVTHDQQEAFAVADLISVMQAGKIAQTGSAEQLYHAPVSRFVAEFLGRGQFIQGKVEKAGNVSTPLGYLPLAESEPFDEGDEVDVLLRPEDLHYEFNSEIRLPVVSRLFRGDRLHLELAWNNHRLLSSAPAHLSIDEGELVPVALQPREAICFARAAG